MFTHSTSPSWLLPELFRTLVTNACDDGNDPVQSQPGLRFKSVAAADFGGKWFSGAVGHKWEGHEELMSRLVTIDDDGFKCVRLFLASASDPDADFFAQVQQKHMDPLAAYLACIGTDASDPADLQPCLVLVAGTFA